MSRLAGLSVLFALTALVGCASTNPMDEDGGVVVERPDAMKGIVDAEPGTPDAPSRPDAGPADAAVPMPPDASIPHPPDAAVPLPDASIPHPPDAAVPLPDASTGCTTSTTNLLSNANFDTGPGAMWTETGGAGELILKGTNLPHPAHSGTYAAYLGGYDNGTDTLTQTIIVPAGTTALRFTGQRWVETAEAANETTVYDTLKIEILAGTTGTTLLEAIPPAPAVAYSNRTVTTAWTPFDFALASAYAGQTIRLKLTAVTDDSGIFTTPTSFFFDTISLEATVCQ
jgi:hypothetical protein